MSGRALHHVGYVVASISRGIDRFARPLAATWDGTITHDPLQKVHVAFVYPGSAREPAIELVEPAGEDSPVTRFLQRGGGLHHLCYEVDSLESELEFVRSTGAVLVKPPLPAVAFDGRRIAWVC